MALTRPPMRFSLVVCATIASALPSHAADTPRAAAQHAQDATSWTTLTLPTSRGQRSFFVASPDAEVSDAALHASKAALADGLPAATTGYRVKARVLVKSADRAPVDAAAGAATVAPLDPTGQSLAGYWVITGTTIRQAAEIANALRADPSVALAHVDLQRPSGLRVMPSDPGVISQWHLKNLFEAAASINVEPAWDSGFTGAGVTVGIVELGWETDHPDLVAKYVDAASQPDAGYTAHGDATAGLVGASANNGIGGAGVAYGAMLSRQYIGAEIDVAAALAFRNDLNSIKSNSWGPVDSGHIAVISPVELQSLADAGTLGRDGKGTVIAWAAGNGGENNDRVDYDPFASSPYSIAIGAIDNLDREALYNEPGSSLMLVTTSSYDFFASDGSGIFTASWSPGYTASFGGTSAAAPIGAGVIAILLEANPALTARDVAHVLIRSARRVNPADPGWAPNAAGVWHNEHFGFGAIDAAAAVTLAQNWENVQAPLDLAYPAVSVGLAVPDNDLDGVESAFEVYPTMKVERVQIVLTAPHPRLGDLRVELTSPGGTKSVFAQPRWDYSEGYDQYAFTSVRHWDENPRGLWTIKVSDEIGDQSGTFDHWQLRLIGSTPKCPCDWNSSGTITVQDLFSFLAGWFQEQADMNNDQVHSVQDLFDFLSCFFAPHPGGC